MSEETIVIKKRGKVASDTESEDGETASVDDDEGTGSNEKKKINKKKSGNRKSHNKKVVSFISLRKCPYKG